MEKKLRKTKGCVIMSVTYSMSQLSEAENWKNKTKSKTFHFFDEEFYRTNIPTIESQKHFWKRNILNKTMAEESTEEVRNHFAIFNRCNQSLKGHWFTKFSFVPKNKKFKIGNKKYSLNSLELEFNSSQHSGRYVFRIVPYFWVNLIIRL